MNTHALRGKLQAVWDTLYELRIALFVLALLLAYGFVVWRINSLSGAQPSQAAIDAQAPAVSQPHIDQKVVDKITQLQDNNVTVQALFDQARQNPFRE